MSMLNRRQFLVGSSGLAASAAALGAWACAPMAFGEEAKDMDEEAMEPVIVDHNPPADLEEGGEWISAACWHNCGGRCMNKVLVKDGIVIRQKTDDTHEDTHDYPQQRGCVRGKAQQQQCFGADRILHPLKRKGWAPGGGENSNGEMRGRDEWEVISWDEAIELACGEIKRIKDEYGNESFYSKTNNATIPWMNAFGGLVASWETQSMGTYSFEVTKMGLPSRDLGNGNDRFDMENADYVVMLASNPTWACAGTPINWWINARDAGAKFYCIDPIYNASAQMLDATWLPVRTGTDIALLLAVAYEMLRLDEEEGDIVDWDFLHTYAVGFDAESMPEDASTDENFMGYVLGEYDGIPKTPEWATEICGTPVELITELARICGKNNKTYLLHNMAAARNHGADDLPQLYMTIGCMGGHFGKPGHACAAAYHANAGNYGPSLVAGGSATPSPNAANPLTLHPRTGDFLEIIANGGGTFTDVGGYGNEWHDREEVTVGPVKCIIHNYDATLQTAPHQKKNIEAHRAVDFVLTIASFMTANAAYADIILPCNTEWERVGSVNAANREYLQVAAIVTDSLGESKSDQQIGELMCAGLGLDPAEVYPITEQQAFFMKLAGATVKDVESGEMVPLVTITADDIAAWGVEGEPQEGIVGLDEIIANGGYQFERSADDGLGSIGYAAFIADPVENPLASNSGKFEIYCQAHYDFMQQVGWDNKEAYKPYPTYVEAPEHVGYHNTFKDGRIGGEKGEFPYLLFNPHYLRRSHSVYDNCPWLRETWANPVFIARSDAEEKGIADGDTVLVSTYVGQTLRRAAVLDILMPGVVGMPHGAWVDVDEETGIDRAGSDNFTIGNEHSGFGVTGYNNQNCNIEKYDGEPIGADCDLPARWMGDMEPARVAPAAAMM